MASVSVMKYYRLPCEKIISAFLPLETENLNTTFKISTELELVC